MTSSCVDAVWFQQRFHGTITWHIEAKTRWPPLWQTTIWNASPWIEMYEICHDIIKMKPRRIVYKMMKFSLKLVPKDPINNIPALVQIMTWHLPGDKPFSELFMVKLQTHICVTRPQRINSLRPADTCLIQYSLGQLMTCHLFSAKPLPEPMLQEQTSMNMW